MRKHILLLISFNFYQPFSTNGQNAHKLNSEGFSIKSDVLAIFNTVIKSSDTEFPAKIEWYFNKKFSLSLSASTETLKNNILSRNFKRLGTEFRWYFKQDNCQCSSLYAGPFFDYNYEKQISNNDSASIYQNYKIRYFNTGVITGYQIYITPHLLLDPSVKLGIFFSKEIFDSVSEYIMQDDNHSGIQLKVILGAGYRF